MRLTSVTLISLMAIALAGCQTTGASPSTSAPTTASTGQSQARSVSAYNPENREEFVFNERAPQLQKYGYDKFCKNTSTFACSNKLNYNRYVGRRGYFISSTPAERDIHGYDFYRVKLDTGEEFFYVANEKYGGKYGSSAPIMSAAKADELASFKAEPLVAGSDIMVTGVTYQYGMTMHSLSNGRSVSDKELSRIRRLSADFGTNSAQVAAGLVGFVIQEDEIERKYFIRPSPSLMKGKSDANVYIGYDGKEPWLRFYLRYYGDDWLFVRSFIIAADEFRWQSPPHDFKRDHSGGNVWEWLDISAGKQEIELARALASAKKATIRLQGKQYYRDVTLTPEQQERIKRGLELFEMMAGTK